MHPAARTRRILGAVVATMFAIGLVGLAVVEADDEGAALFARPSGNGPAPRATPPRPGVYRYRTEPGGTAALHIEADGEAGRITRQLMTLDESGVDGAGGEGGDRGGGGPVGAAALHNEVVWSSAGQHTERSEGSIGAITAGCDWKPRVAEYVFPLAAGASWSTDSSCATTFAGQSVTLRRVERATVKGPGRVTVGGTAVDTWVISRSSTLTLTALIGKRTTGATVVEEFAPAYGLSVRQARTQSFAAAGQPSGGGQDTTVELMLESLDPA